MDISLELRGAAEPQGQVVKGGGQLPGERGVGQGRAAGKPGPLTAACCLTQGQIFVRANEYSTHINMAPSSFLCIPHLN